jgi:hypothetical protein
MYSKPSELLADMDSHSIQNAKMLEECQFDTSMVPTFSMKETEANMKARGLGGWIEGKPEDRLIYGWTTAAALARQFLGNAPGSAFMGRGSSFRADLAALEKAGH